jgi:hypothetical protein
MNTILRSVTLALVIAAAIQCFTVGYLSPKLSLEVCRPMVHETRSQTFAPVPQVHLVTQDGAVQVHTHHLNNIRVDADLRAYADDSNSQVLATTYLPWLVKVEEGEETLKIVTEPGERPDQLAVLVNYVIYIPEGTAIRVDGANGNVFVGPGSGEVAIRGKNTDVEVTEPLGRVEAKVLNGRISVTNAKFPATLETVNGSIRARMMGGALQAKTDNGNIYAYLLDPGVSACDLTATNGGITLAMAEDCSAEVSATTGGGPIRSDFLLKEIRGVRRRDALHATIGDGKTRLTMNSLNGDILITRSDT